MRRLICWLALLAGLASPAFAQISISNLPQANTMVGTEPLPVVQNGQTRKATVAAVGAPRDFIDGFILATAGSSTTFTVAPGQATDSTGLYRITNAVTLTKTSASWIQGTGGCLDTGAVGVSTWYHVFAIENVSTGVADVLCSTSLTPLMPSGWTARRRIGSMKTNGSAQWNGFLQVGDAFVWVTPILDVNNVAPTVGTPNTVALSTPPGVVTEARFNLSVTFSSGAFAQLRTYPVGGLQPQTSVSAYVNSTTVPISVFTNTASQIMTVMAQGGGTPTYFIETTGWVDLRGKNS